MIFILQLATILKINKNKCSFGVYELKKEIVLDWWPMTRDCAAYAVSVIALIIFMADELVYWYEALILVSLYLIYILVMYNNEKISAKAHEICTCWVRRPLTDTSPLLPSQNKTDGSSLVPDYQVEAEHHHSFTECTLWKVFISPIRLLLFFTIPDCKKYTKLYPITFIMCIVWIGSSTYVITWMITIIGDTLGIPDSVMGITFLAAGTSVPEAVSSVIVTRQGHGGMGISNSLGSNTFDALLCLGLPWLIKSSMLALFPDPINKDPEEITRAVMINSRGLEYSAISLLSSTFLLYLTFSFYHFRLNSKVGVACVILYILFISLASTIELNVFFTVNLPTCPL